MSMKKGECASSILYKRQINGNELHWTPAATTFHNISDINEFHKDTTLNTSCKSKKRNLQEKEETRPEKRICELRCVNPNQVMTSRNANSAREQTEADDYLRTQESNLAEQERKNKNAKEQERRLERRSYLDMLKDENPLVGLCAKRPDDNTTLRLTEAYIEQKNFHCSLHHCQPGDDLSLSGSMLTLLQKKQRMFGMALIQPRIQSENRRVRVASILDVTAEVETYLRRNRVDMLCEDFFNYVHTDDHPYLEGLLTQKFLSCQPVLVRCRMLKGSLTSSTGNNTSRDGGDTALVEICGEISQHNRQGRILCATVKLVEDVSLNRVTLHEALRENFYRTRHRYDDMKQASTILDVSHSIAHLTGWLAGQVKLKNALEYIYESDKWLAMTGIHLLLRNGSYNVVYRLRIPGAGGGSRLLTMLSEGHKVDTETFVLINSPISEKRFVDEYTSQHPILKECFQQLQRQMTNMAQVQRELNGVHAKPLQATILAKPYTEQVMLRNEAAKPMELFLTPPQVNLPSTSSSLASQQFLPSAQGPSRMVYPASTMDCQPHTYLTPYFQNSLVTHGQNEAISSEMNTFGQTYYQL